MHRCESRYHQYAGMCTNSEIGMPRGGGYGGGGRSHVMPDVNGSTGDWKCDKCGNLNFAHRTRCNRCHIEMPQPYGASARPAPARCPYTIMLSPADRSRGGLQVRV